MSSKEKNQHLVFYDGECGFCDQTVQFLLKADSHKQFLFAPLQGKTAAKELKQLPKEYKGIDTLILIENYNKPKQKFYILGKAGLRICWHLGGFWLLLGWLSFLPSFLYDWAYRLVARNRRYLAKNPTCPIPNKKTKDRFLE